MELGRNGVLAPRLALVDIRQDGKVILVASQMSKSSDNVETRECSTHGLHGLNVPKRASVVLRNASVLTRVECHPRWKGRDAETRGRIILGSLGRPAHRRVREVKWCDTDIINVLINATRKNKRAAKLADMANGNTGRCAARLVQEDSVTGSSTTYAPSKKKNKVSHAEVLARGENILIGAHVTSPAEPALDTEAVSILVPIHSRIIMEMYPSTPIANLLRAILMLVVITWCGHHGPVVPRRVKQEDGRGINEIRVLQCRSRQKSRTVTPAKVYSDHGACGVRAPNRARAVEEQGLGSTIAENQPKRKQNIVESTRALVLGVHGVLVQLHAVVVTW